MDNLEYFKNTLGNVFREHLKDIYDKDEAFFSAFADLTAPNSISDDCKDCKNQYFCNGCILRGFICGMRTKGCNWLARIPKMLKEKLILSD